MTDCARGCTHHNQHATACLCTPECADHPNHCKGCLPRAADIGHYCQRCADKFRDALHGIPDLIVLVANGQTIRHQTPGDTSRRPTKVDQQSPSPAWDTTDEVILWAAAWAWIVAGRPGYDPTRYTITGLPARELTRSISHISNRLTQALSDDYHAELVAETLNLHRRLTLQTGEDRLTHRIKQPCPDCNHRTLIREDGEDFVICRNRDCRREWSEDEYGRLALVIAS